MTAKTVLQVKGATLWWTVSIGRGVTRPDLERHVPTLIQACERAGVCDPRLLADELTHNQAFQWLLDRGVRMYGFSKTSQPGRIDFLSDDDLGGIVREDLEDLPLWLAERLRWPGLVQKKIEKLRATGRPELHLFLVVHDTGMPFSLYYPFAFGDHVPRAPLAAPSGLTGLWLSPGWEESVLWWSATQGWARADLE